MKNNNQSKTTPKKNKAGVAPSSVDMKNNAASQGYTPASTRVKPKSGRGLANEGTITSYEGER